MKMLIGREGEIENGGRNKGEIEDYLKFLT